MPRPEGSNAVDALGVEQVLLVAGDVDLKIDRPTDDLVGRRFVDAAGVVVTPPDTRHVTGGRHEGQQAGGWIIV